MDSVKVLADILREQSAGETGIRFLQSGDREPRVSYADLMARASGLLGRFQQQGLQPGDPVILFVRNNTAFVDAFWACQSGGLVPVPLSAGVYAEYLHKLLGVMSRFPAPFLFTERELLQRLYKIDGGKHIPAQRVCLLEDIKQLDAKGVLHPAQPEDTAMIQFSSGSTSEPKGVVLSHANLLANIRAISSAADITVNDSTLSWMPLSHDMGLVGFHLVPLFNGLNQVLMDTELFIRRPARWLDSAHRYRNSLLCSPNFGYQHYLKSVSQPAESLDLSAVRLIFNGAEPVSASVCREFAQRLAPAGLNANVFYPVYGLAEASLAVTFPVPGRGLQTLDTPAHKISVGDRVVPGDNPEHGVELVCLGHPVDGCELRIVDGKGSVLSDNSVGHVQIRGANVTRGYYQCRSCDEAAFVDGWLDTGDLGLMNERGLFITGRARDILFVSGQNWYPQDIEQVLQQAAALPAGKVAVSAVRDPANAEDLLLVFVQFRREPETFIDCMQQVQSTLAQQTGLHAHAVIPVNSIPRTTSGKLQRYRLAEAFAQGEYADVLATIQAYMAGAGSTSAGNDVGQQLIDVCRQVFPDRDIKPDQNLFELGADSLMLVKIHEEIDMRFPGKVEVTDLFDYPTISSLAGYISRP
ncbi:MAG: mutanobactin A non-ribosomal peptide synthetase MubE [Gammaproteobacteria bacterium]|nr:MAG: mutanobactin A non-ribosomal peptide synthetase MubE [Gammaproteobacteria bacterium]